VHISELFLEHMELLMAAAVTQRFYQLTVIISVMVWNVTPYRGFSDKLVFCVSSHVGKRAHCCSCCVHSHLLLS